MDIYKNDAQYIRMSADELRSLPDEELFYAVMVRIEQKVDGYEDWEEGIQALNDCQKVFYAVSWLEVEVNNGGLCQFFVNSSRMVAPLVSDCMAILGADAHKELYDTFVANNKIDLNDLSSFDCEAVEDFTTQYERYPFDDYDNAFYGMEPLESFLTRYARKHIEWL